MENKTNYSLIKTNFMLIGTSCLNVGATVFGKIIWNGFKVSLLDSSVKTLALQTTQFLGWTVIAHAIGSLFGTFLPCWFNHKPNPNLGMKMGILLGGLALGVQVYSLGSIAMLSYLVHTATGAAVGAILVGLVLERNPNTLSQK